MDAKTNFELSSYDPEEVEELQSAHSYTCSYTCSDCRITIYCIHTRCPF